MSRGRTAEPATGKGPKETTDADNETWTPQQTAEYLGRSVTTLAKWRCTGERPDLPYIRDDVSGSIRYMAKDVMDWKRRHTQRRNATLVGDCRRLA